jgi:thioredoxin reductase (NADPH)
MTGYPQTAHCATPTVYDLAIVGAGPVGLYAAFYAGLRNLSTAVIDRMSAVGGQLTAFYPSQPVYDVPGFAGTSAADIVLALAQQTRLAAPDWFLGSELLDLKPADQDTHFEVVTTTGQLSAKAVLLALGAGALRCRKLAPAITDHWIGRGVTYGLPDTQSLSGRAVVIYATGETASRWAAELSKSACAITIITHRRLTHLPPAVQQLTGVDLIALHGNSTIQAAQFQDPSTGEVHRLSLDALLIQPSYDTDLSLLGRLPLGRTGNAIAVDHTMQTTRPGIYACGDICTYPGKLKLIATGFGEAAIAVNHLCQRIRAGAPLFPGHSTQVATKRLTGLKPPVNGR